MGNTAGEPWQRINARGLDIVKKSESLRLRAYKDTGGVWTIGYGHTRGVKPGQVCTRAQADRWLVEDVRSAEDDVRNLVRVDLNDNQFSALVSFVFNIGGDQFRKSTLLKNLNAGDYDLAADEFLRWVYDNKKTPAGLEVRRQMERALFLTTEEDASPE